MITRSIAIDLVVLTTIAALSVAGMFMLDRFARSIGAASPFDRDAAWAATTATVSATVRFQTFSVTVSDGSINYGSVAANATNDTKALGDSQTVTNDSTQTADLNIKGINAFVVAGGGTNWTLGDATGANQYRHQFATEGAAFGAGNTLDAAAFKTLMDNNPAGDKTTLDLRITMPASDSNNGATMDTSVTLQATAP